MFPPNGYNLKILLFVISDFKELSFNKETSGWERRSEVEYKYMTYGCIAVVRGSSQLEKEGNSGEREKETKEQELKGK